MRFAAVTLALLAIPGTLLAQPVPIPAPGQFLTPSPPITSSDSTFAGQSSPNLTQPYHGLSRTDTPTQRRERLKRAVALRDEYHRLLAEDGGTLTAANQRYIRRRARAILAR